MTARQALENSDHAYMYVWGPKNGGTSPFVTAGPRPQERVLEGIRRGGFPLLRQDNCRTLPAPRGAGVHAALENFLAGN